MTTTEYINKAEALEQQIKTLEQILKEKKQELEQLEIKQYHPINL